MENAVAPILNGIAKRLKLIPLCLINRQFVNASIAPIKIAASPPNKRNVRKIIESEKLRINFERGRIILIRGAIRMVNKQRSINCHEKTANFK